jgi:hypothetical protein
MSLNLNPEKALIFRIVHVANVPWILRNGLHCRNSDAQDPNYVNIGNVELIDKRSRRRVPIAPGGTLSDYVPFYFTPWSIMLLKIKTGHGGIPRRESREIVFFVSSVHRLREQGVPYVFTDQHAYVAGAEFLANTEDLVKIDWPLLRSRNFQTDADDPGKQARYQAEALVHRHVPVDALLGLACYDEEVKDRLDAMAVEAGVSLFVKVTRNWYFEDDSLHSGQPARR